MRGGLKGESVDHIDGAVGRKVRRTDGAIFWIVAVTPTIIVYKTEEGGRTYNHLRSPTPATSPTMHEIGIVNGTFEDNPPAPPRPPVLDLAGNPLAP